MAYVRTVRTASGAQAVEIVHGSRRGSQTIEHVGSAHDEAELEALKAAARQRLAGGQGELDLGLGAATDTTAGIAAVPSRSPSGRPLETASSRMGPLWDGLSSAYDTLGFDQAAGRDEVFRQLVLARIIEPTSKLDSLRVLAEVGVDAPSYPALNRRLRSYAEDGFRRKLAKVCAQHAALGPASLVLYDVSTLYFETDTGDGFREPGFSKERRLEPQIAIGLLTDAAGFPLMLEAFEGNTAETTTMLPTIRAFMAAHQLPDVTVADAGMISAANKQAIEAAELRSSSVRRSPTSPTSSQWRREHPDESIPDGLIPTQPWPAGPTDQRRDQVIYYQYRADRARRTLHGIDEQVTKAERAVAGKVPVKRNRFIRLVGADKSVNRTLEAKVWTLAGWKGYTTNLAVCPDGTPVNPQSVIDAYHRLFQIEASFRMSKHDLAARPIYRHKRESIEAHLTIVFAALAVGRLVEERTGWSIRRFVRTARRYRTVQIRAGLQILTAEDPLPDDLQEALALIIGSEGAHQLIKVIMPAGAGTLAV